ncbi:MAG: SRPBCC domain-containing protein [Saprospiraceae bacterium]|jgi:uncharacterized protein YndB with AHSA1/START domain|nr:SRPBCC domain-containing protein [Saprospiraceae bacterium]MBK9566435.1 SRPBCC domain-containing protein [Saprospiraceae bacterium]MBP6448226.1 SRPBCC domain-containing protein [Saprospiraceae bacterium]
MNDKITVSAVINADKNRVWAYYTNPKHIVNWNFADPSWHCPKAENDMRVGGIYYARMEARDGSFGFDFLATYTELDPGNHFTYEFGGRIATISMAESDDKTTVTIVFDPETENALDLQQTGWQMILNNFKNYAEKH